MEEFSRTFFGSGLKPEQLDIGQVALRAIIIYVVTLAIVRLGKKRFMGRGSAFDVVIGIVVGSIAGRAITGNAPLANAMAATAVLLAMHWLLSSLAMRWHWFGVLVKGRNQLLVRAGKVDESTLRREHLSHADLEEDLREKGRSNLADVREARIERDGKLSVIESEKRPRVVDISVEAGVHTLRIEMD